MSYLNEKILVVCDRDSRYANGLGENIAERKELALQVHVCTGVESMKRFMEENRADILIVDEKFPYEERSEMQAGQTFVLTRETADDLGENETAVLKFQSADKILAIVFAAYYDSTNRSILKEVRKPKQRMLAVYSPIHRIGKTEFAIAFGKELAKTEKTLYINLEEHPDINGRFSREEERNLGDLLYYMRQEEQNLAMRLAVMVQRKEDLDILPPILNQNDLKEINILEWQTLLQRISDESSYETIVVDLGDSVQGHLDILASCDEIFMPILEDEISMCKLQQFEYNLELHQYTELLKKIHRFPAEENMESCGTRWAKEDLC